MSYLSEYPSPPAHDRYGAYAKLVDDLGNLYYYSWAVSLRLKGYLRDIGGEHKKEVKAHAMKSYKRILREFILPSLRSLEQE
jgi:hypothetical protein